MKRGKPPSGNGKPPQAVDVLQPAGRAQSMTFANSPAAAEIDALLETLRAAEQRLAELTEGKADAVVDSAGHTYFLRRAQETFQNEAVRQAGILNALPAHIALLDAQGTIVAVNNAWREFASANAPERAMDVVGANYLETCDPGLTDSPSQPHPVADGIRSVLGGAADKFSMEYPCHSPTRERWFLLLVNPLSDDRRNGVIVMHVDISEEKEIEARLRYTQQCFLQMADSIHEVFFVIDPANGQMLYVSPAFEHIWGLTTATLYENSESWFQTIHADDRAATIAAFKEGVVQGSFALEYRIVRKDGAIRWIEAKAFAVYDDAGNSIRITGVAADITSRKVSELRLKRLNVLHIVLSKIGEAIRYTRDRHGLYDAVCRILVQHGGLHLALIVPVDAGVEQVPSVVSFGAEPEYPREPLSSIFADLVPGISASVQHALLNGRPDVCNDIAGIKRRKRWREAALKNGSKACASFPLNQQGVLVGILVIYSAEVGYFQEDELRLLTTMAIELSFALDALDVEHHRRLEEEKSQHIAALLSMAARVGRLGAWTLELPSLALTWSSEVFAIHGLPSDFVPTVEKGLDYFPPEFRLQIAAAVEACIGEGIPFDVELQMDTANGERIWVRSIGEAVRDRDGKIHRVHGAFQDINERKQAEEALRQSEQKFRSMFVSAAVGIAISTLQGRYLEANAAYCRMLGYSESELHALDFALLTHPDDLSANLELRDQLLSGQRESFLMEKRYLRKDGAVIWTRSTVSALRSKEEKPVALMVVAEDITDSKQADQEIRFNELRYRSLVQATSAIVWDTPASGEFETEQPRWSAFTGQSFEELRGNGWLNAVHPDDRSETARVWAAAVVGRTMYEVEHRLRARDQTYRNMVVRAVPITSDDGTIVRWIGIHTDITEQRRVQAALRESEERYRALIEWSPEAIAVQRDGKLIYVNPAGIKLAGAQSAQDLIGKSIMDLVHPDSRQLVLERTQNSKEIGVGNGLVEQKLIALDGRIVDVEVQAMTIMYDGKPALYGSLRDITARKRAEAALKLSEFSVNNASTATFWILSDARILRVNRAACEMLGYDEAELLEKRITDINVELSADRWPAHWERLRELGRTRLEGLYRRKDGHQLPVEIDLNWFEFEGQEYRFASVRDISERKLAEERINYLNRVHAVLSGINTLIVRVREREELFKEACRIAVEKGWFRLALLGIVNRSTMKMETVAMHAADKPLERTIQGILDESQGALTPMVIRAIEEKKAIIANDSQNDPQVASGNRHIEFGVRSMVILPLIVADEVVGVFALYSNNSEFFHAAEMELLEELAGDISFAIDNIAKAEKLNYLAYYDVLTGLANRSLFLERLAQFMRSAASDGHQLAIGLIDLERFKNINDSLGQPSGDELLKQVAQWLTRSAGDANLLARVDADHFAFVLPHVRPAGDLARLIEKQRNAFLEQIFHLGDSALRIAFKVGVAIYPEDGKDAETLFKNAEAALKKAKAIGEPYLFYTQNMSTAGPANLTMENQLRQAVDNGEFVLHYQPKVNLASGKVTGAEALIRWNDPKKGLVSPATFIPILEETGLIRQVGRWALRQALEDFLRWRVISGSGMDPLRIAVNVSPLQLRHRDFVADIEQAISISSHAAAGLELEITESVIMQDVRHNSTSLQAIRAMGVSVAIDDFGTGFSSLSYLSKLPIDTLKIDRSFVVDMMTGPEGLALVSTIINLAHSLKVNVVAEGVETEEQSRLLRLLSCDEMQGYLVSKPVPVEVFEAKFLAFPAA